MSLRMIFRTGNKLRCRWIFLRKLEYDLSAEIKDTSLAVSKTSFKLTAKLTLFTYMHFMEIYSVLST